MAHLCEAADGCLMFLRKQDGNRTVEFPPQTTGYIATIYLCNRGGCEAQNISPQEVEISKDEAPQGP